MKCCTGCRVEKPITEFAKGGKIAGVQQYKPKCKACTNEMQSAIRNTGRVHQTNVREEKCPFGKGVRAVPIRGWGFAGATR